MMLQSRLVFILLLPFSLLYGLVVALRNIMYEKGLLKSVSFDIPIISVGNLSVGGAGKTPHIEYLILLLRDHLQLATLSRGYKRKSVGFLDVQPHLSADQTGDEPLQYKRKFHDVHVCVSESRVLGVPKLLGMYPETQTILLDDAFQHRSIRPGLNILLTEYSKPYYDDFLMPSGRLREWHSASSRADIVIVSKCPVDEKLIDKAAIVSKLGLTDRQQVFFTHYLYGSPYYLYQTDQRLQLSDSHNVIMISAIAGTDYLNTYLQQKVNFVHNLSFEDHHDFSKNEMGQLKKVFDNLDLPNKYILTTEKDAVRMDQHRDFLLEYRLPVFVLPVKVRFHFNQGEEFDQLIKDFLLDFQV